MELNVMELYKSLGENPANFQTVLKNFYGHELATLKSGLLDFLVFLEKESGEDASRNRFIEDSFENFSNDLAGVQQNMSYFRYVNICSDGQKMLTSEDLRIILRELEEQTRQTKDDFSGWIEKGDSWKTQDLPSFETAKELSIKVLKGIGERLDEIDKLLAI